MVAQPKTLSEWLAGAEIEPQAGLLVYENAPQVKEEALYELAERFELEAEPEKKQDLTLLRQEKRTLSVYNNSGAFWYADRAKLHQPDYRPELPDRDQAAELAMTYLKEHDWLPEGAMLDGVQYNEFERLEGREDRKRTKQPNHVCVDFRFSFNQLPTYGPGAKIKVFLGNEGEVIGVLHAAPTLRKYKEYPRLSAPELEKVLKSKLGISLEEVKLVSEKLAYHTESFLLKTRFVQPVYVFELATQVQSSRREEPTVVEFETHPIPATTFSPIVTIKAPRSLIEIKQGQVLSLACDVSGGTPPFDVRWSSNMDGLLGKGQKLETGNLSVAHRERKITSHTIRALVTDANGMQDSHYVLVKVYPLELADVELPHEALPDDPDDPYVGVEWCNIYHGLPGLADISGTNDSAKGFKDGIQALPNWSSRFDWGNDAAWEEDFKFATAPGGGTDSYWADNVDFAFFAGHGGPGSFFFGYPVDDHEMRAQDARWGDGRLNWIVLHACQTMRANFEWTVWTNAFKGLHQMFGFHTNTQGSNPPLGTRFAHWLADGYTMQSAWETACTECYSSSRIYSVIYANQPGTDTHNDHLPGYGHVSSDPTSPSIWTFYKGTC